MASHFQKYQKRQSVVTSNGNYRSSCSSGFNSTPGSQAHHILPLSSMVARADSKACQDPTAKEYIENCLWVTAWDINDADNLIGLPTNKQHKQGQGTNPANLPSHQVDHNTAGGYCSEVTSWLEFNLWNTLRAQKSNPHKVDIKTIEGQLKACSRTFRAKLISRGARETGTAMCWKLRFDKGYEKRWYRPFSMAAMPRRRHPGLNLPSLKKIFTLLGI